MKRASKQQQSHNLIVNKVYIQSLCIRNKKRNKNCLLNPVTESYLRSSFSLPLKKTSSTTQQALKTNNYYIRRCDYFFIMLIIIIIS